ncbi:hypothetical protein ACO1O0_002501 [Amphichorda felina]
MRSRPYAPPPPLPPIFDELAAVLPFPKPAYRSRDDADIPLDTLDHDTSQLIPTKKRTHRVWVQGQLVDVRTVSTTTRSKSTSGYDRGVSGSRRRRSLDDTANFDHEEDRETVLRTKQLRGYGIGGVGNIRRPTDVIHGPNPPTRTRTDSEPLSHDRQATSSREYAIDKHKWNIRELFALTADNKGKSRAI